MSVCDGPTNSREWHSWGKQKDVQRVHHWLCVRLEGKVWTYWWALFESSTSIMPKKILGERCMQEFLVWTPRTWCRCECSPRSARMKLMMKCLIEEQVETIRLWTLCLYLIVKIKMCDHIVCVVCCTSLAASAVVGRGSSRSALAIFFLMWQERY